MQPPPLNPIESKKHSNDYSTALAVPFSFIPFAGLAVSMLVLGFIGAISIWTRRKRAFVGTGIAFLAVIISITSSFVATGALLASRNAATTKLAQMQTQLEAAKLQASNSSDKSALADLIGIFDSDHNLTNEQANILGKVGESIIKWLMSDQNTNSDQSKK
jgi:hypothetical protein